MAHDTARHGVRLKGIPDTFNGESFLRSGRRGIHTWTAPWTRANVPDLHLVVVGGEIQTIKKLEQIVSGTKHRLSVVSPTNLAEYVSKNEVDAILADPAQIDHVHAFDAIPTVCLPGSNIPASLAVFQLRELDKPSLLSALAEMVDVASVVIVAEEKDHAERLVAPLKIVGEYFSVQTAGWDELNHEKNPLKSRLDSSVILYVGRPSLSRKNGEPHLDTTKRVRELARHAPVVYVNPNQFFRNNNLVELFNVGLFDFVGTNIAQYLLSDSTAQEDKQQRDFLFSIERIVNAIHGAVGSRLAYRSSPREAREYARQHMPYIFLHTPFHGLDGTINNLLGVIGANIMHSHIGKRINNFAAETLEEHRGLIEAWQPNVVYYYIAHAEAVPHVIELSKALPGSTFFVAHPNLNKSVLLVLNGLSNVVVEPRPNRGIIAERLAEQWHKYLGRLRNTHVYKIRGVTRNVSQHLREVQASDLEGALSQQFKFEEGKPTPVCTAVPVYPGASSGRLFTSETYDRICSAVEAKQRGERVILYVEDLASLDLSTVKMARGLDGLIFRRVSQENHHVVDLRRSGIPMIQLREGLLESTIDGFTLSRSQPISFDGSTGEIFSGQYRTVPSQLAPAKLLGDQNLRGSAERYQTALRDADGILSDLGKQIFINADTTEQMVKARDWGVCSVGLVRSEGILKRNREALIIYGRFLLSLANDQSNTVPEQEFIASQREVYERILSFQRGERTQIRLLDPPIHELFSASVALETRASYGRKFGSSVADNALTDRKESLRGAQLLGKFSGIYRAQLRALFDAYNSVITKEGVDSDLRIFIPYVEDVEQVRRIKAMADDINQKEFGDAIRYELGVTLETIGGCIAAGDMIRDLRIKNFAIGSNDLFPFIDGTADRYSGQLAYVGNASDGTPLLKPAIRAFLERTLDLIVDAAKEADLDVNVGLCGEMNSVKLHPENLGPLLHRFDYLSASRPKQIPVITLLWAQTLHKLYGCPQSPSN